VSKASEIVGDRLAGILDIPGVTLAELTGALMRIAAHVHAIGCKHDGLDDAASRKTFTEIAGMNWDTATDDRVREAEERKRGTS
jgi:hypothetical protein